MGHCRGDRQEPVFFTQLCQLTDVSAVKDQEMNGSEFPSSTYLYLVLCNFSQGGDWWKWAYHKDLLHMTAL
jgi:hypothetical protein